MTLLPKVKLHALVSFPATVLDGTGVDVVKTNGTYQFNLDFGDFAPPTAAVTDSAQQNALLWNANTGAYTLVPMSVFASAPSSSLPLMDGTATVGISTLYSREDHIHPSDTSRAPLASPTFTGDPKAPTPTAGDNDTSIATTAFVTAAVGAVAGGAGNCVLNLSGGNLVLTPKGGNLLTVNGVLCSVPDAGVSLAPSGLTASTLYYIYATASAGAVNTLEASTTTHAISTATGNKGVEIKSGDNTRTLVGMAYVSAGPVFDDSAAKRNVRSWFNRRSQTSVGAIASTTTTTSISLAELSTNARTEFLVWSGDETNIRVSAQMAVSVATADAILSIGLDGSTTSILPANVVIRSQNTTGSQAMWGYNETVLLTTEGRHFISPIVSTSSGTATFASCHVEARSF